MSIKLSEDSKIRKKTKNTPYSQLVVNPDKKSVYWKYYGFPADENGVIIDKETVVCILCKKQFIYNRNTSNLRAHLNTSRHKDVFKDAGKDFELETEVIIPDDMNVDDQICEIAVMSETQDTNEEFEKPNVRDISNVIVPMDVSSNVLSEFSSCLIGDLLSPDILCGSFVCNLLSENCTKVNNIRSKFTNELIPSLYNECKESERELITKNHISVFSLMVEEWTSASKQSYVSISVNYLMNKTLPLRTIMLKTVHCLGTESTQYWTEFINRLLAEWYLNPESIEGVIVAVTNENIKEALVERKFMVVPCMLHLLRTAVQKCFDIPEFAEVATKVHDIVVLAYEIKAPILGDNAINLLNDYEIWFVKYDFFALAVNCKTEFSIFLSTYAAMLMLTLTEHEWCMLEEIVEYVQPFRTIITTMMEEKLPSVSLVEPLYTKILSPQMIIKPGDSPFVKNMKMIMTDMLKDVYKSPGTYIFTQVALCLDPRFKTFSCYDFNDMDRILNKLAVTYMDAEATDEDTKEVVDEKSSKGLRKLLGNFYKNKRQHVSNEDKVKMEISVYKSQGMLTLDESPLDWWEQMKSCPSLKRAAYTYLCMPLVIRPKMCHSSDDYRKYYARRARLSDDVVDHLIFLNCNKANNMP